LNIAVCVKQVPDTETKVKISDDKKSIIESDINFILNPYDEFGVEEALKIKEQIGNDSSVKVYSVGSDSSKDSIRKALAMGADEGVLLKDENNRDSIGIAIALTDEIKKDGCEIVFCGKQSVDYDNSIIGQLIAEILDFSCISVVVDLKIDGTKVIAEREIEGGREVVEAELPIVISAQKGLNEPRYASLKGIMAAKKKTIEEKPAASGNNLTEVVKMYLPPPKKPGRIIGTDSSAVPELVRLLREEAKVI